MTLDDVREELERIKKVGEEDYESAYASEIDLYKDVLRTVERDERVPLCLRLAAREALKAEDLDFSRYTA